MSQFDDLLNRLVPNGLPFSKLSEVARIEGKNVQPSAMGTGEVTVYSLPAFDAGRRPEELVGNSVGSAKTQVSEPAVLVSKLNPHIPRVWKLEELPSNSYCSPEFYPLIPDSKFLEIGYLYYFILNKMNYLSGVVTGSTNSHKRLQRHQVLELPIQLPPLEVQREIVRILDQFTQLEAELEAELEARRAQYDHYRSLLLNSHYASEKQKEIKEVLDLRAGRFIAASRISGVQDEENRIPCFGGGGLRGFVNEANQNGDHVLIGRQGALCGNVKRALGEFYATEHAVVVSPLEELDMSWVYHKLASMELNQYASKSAQPGLAVGTLNKLEIRIPPLSDQKEIGRVLDSMDSLVNDLERGLPAELKARRQQYAYYRDRLLTFKEVEVEA